MKTKFKETEIGMIPNDWDALELKDVLDKGGYIRGPFGSSLRRPEMKSEGIPIYEQQHAIYNHRKFRFYIDEEKYEKLRRFTVQENDLIISCSGTFGKISMIHKNDPKGIISQALLILRPDTQKINPHFLKYFFISDKGFDAIASRSLGSVQINIAKRGVIEKIKFAIPKNITEQNNIVNILLDLDSKIELNQKINKTLEETTKAIFKHWFFHFEFPNDKGNPYKSSKGKMVCDELGRYIPEGWDVITFEEAAEFTRGFSYRGSEKSKIDGKYAFVTLNSVKEFGGFKREFSHITSDRIKDKNFVYRGDIVVANTEQTKTGTLLGYPALVEFPSGYEEDKSVISHHITKVIPKLKNFKHYLYCHLFLYQQNAVKYHTGSVIWALDVKNWSKHEKIILPDQKILQKFEILMEIIFQKSLENNLQLETLLHVRDSLLTKLMSGKIRVPIEVQ